ncbi:MAG: hypothetical protein D6738_07475 [Acidobacteria bacterium]|nr:MAG: hypothetical protein D6738_07475 [Acidobacteriota bacterium]
MTRLSLLAAAMLAAGAAPAAAGLFDVPDPEIVYEGAAPGLAAGVTVIRSAQDLEKVIANLEPAPDRDRLDVKDRTLLLVVGRPRENACRETLLEEISTRGIRARVRLTERFAEKGCACAGTPRPPRAFLVAVGRIVRRATLLPTDAVVPCTPGLEQGDHGAKGPELLFEASWDDDAGGRIIADAGAWAEACARMSPADRCPEIDFDIERVVLVTGRARSNGCRETRVIKAVFASEEEAAFTVEEIYPGRGQMCTQIFRAPKVFAFRVPASVMRVRVTTRESRR